MHTMSANELRSARTIKGLTQAQAATRLGVSQPYVAMLESGVRRLTRPLARRVMHAYDLPPTAVPASSSTLTEKCGAASLARNLAALKYPGFAHLRPHRWTPKNPAEVLLAALAKDDLEPRLVEALPWLLLHYPNLDREWLVREAKVRDLQNRLGFVVSLARRLAERTGTEDNALAELERDLERSRLVREDTLGKLPEAERRWLQKNQPADAKHWNVLTDWTVGALRYA
jgi:transcriptional regulator with XRE-family HTH domain